MVLDLVGNVHPDGIVRIGWETGTSDMTFWELAGCVSIESVSGVKFLTPAPALGNAGARSLVRPRTSHSF